MVFVNRSDAGHRLAQALRTCAAGERVVLALPRGGVAVAAEVAAALDAPIGLVLVRKIGVPADLELAMGAVVDDGGPPVVVRNDGVIARAGVDEAAFNAARDRELAEIARRRQLYGHDSASTDITGRVAIIVDDGVATGATIKAALRAMRERRPARLVLAVPVAPTDTLADLRHEADAVVCLEEHADFRAIGGYYADFRQLSDADVIGTLARFKPGAAAAPQAPA